MYKLQSVKRSFIFELLSLVAKKLSSGIPTRSDTNRAVQPQKMAIGLKFRIKVVEGLYYPCSENKGADQLLIYFVFAYAESRFSHDAAHMYIDTFYS